MGLDEALWQSVVDLAARDRDDFARLVLLAAGIDAEVLRLTAERDEARRHAREHHLEACETCAAIDTELMVARETNARLNRRCQNAEAGLAARLAEIPGGSTLGRSLANSAAAMYRAERDDVLARVKQLELGASKQNDEICQTLGRALGYPRYADDQDVFPGATDADGVCVGDHVAETLAEEAARRIEVLTAEVRQFRETVGRNDEE